MIVDRRHHLVRYRSSIEDVTDACLRAYEWSEQPCSILEIQQWSCSDDGRILHWNRLQNIKTPATMTLFTCMISSRKRIGITNDHVESVFNEELWTGVGGKWWAMDIFIRCSDVWSAVIVIAIIVGAVARDTVRIPVLIELSTRDVAKVICDELTPVIDVVHFRVSHTQIINDDFTPHIRTIVYSHLSRVGIVMRWSCCYCVIPSIRLDVRISSRVHTSMKRVVLFS